MLNQQIVQDLDSKESSSRLGALETLRGQLKVQKGKLNLIPSMPDLFDKFPKLLQDQSATVVYSATQLLIELKKEYTKPSVFKLLPKIVAFVVVNLAHMKTAIRKASLECIIIITSNSIDLINTFVDFGLKHENWKVRNETCEAFMLCLANSNPHFDYSHLISSFCGRLKDVSDVVISNSACALATIRSIIGHDAFNNHLETLDKSEVNLCIAIRDKLDDILSKKMSGKLLTTSTFESSEKNISVEGNSDLVFGVIPRKIIENMSNPDDWRAKASAVDQLQTIIVSLDDISVLLPHMGSLSKLLVSLISDTNIKVILLSLNIVENLVSIPDSPIVTILENCGAAVLHKVADERSVIRHAAMKIILGVINNSTPNSVVNLCLSNLVDTNDRVKEECVNILTMALLKYEKTIFNTGTLFKAVIPLLNLRTKPFENSAMRQAVLDFFAIYSTRFSDQESFFRELKDKGIDENALQMIRKKLHAPETFPKIQPSGLVDHWYKIQKRSRSMSLEKDPEIPNEFEAQIKVEKSDPNSFPNSRRASDMPYGRTRNNALPLSLTSRLPPLKREAIITSSGSKNDQDDLSIPVHNLSFNIDTDGKPFEANGEFALSKVTQKRLQEKMSKLYPEHLKKSNLTKSSTANEVTLKQADNVVARNRGFTIGSKASSENASEIKNADLLFLSSNLSSLKDWEAKFKCLNAITFILKQNSEETSRIIKENLNDITISICAEVTNLRTQVARVAISTLECLFEVAGKSFCTGTPSLEFASHALLKKCGESSGKESFMAEDIDKALGKLYQIQGKISPIRVALSLASLSDHKNAQVRMKVSTGIAMVLQSLTPAIVQKLLTSYKDGDKLLTSLAKFISDGHQETRLAAKDSIRMIYENSSKYFMEATKKILVDKDFQVIKKCLGENDNNGNLNVKGSCSSIGKNGG